MNIFLYFACLAGSAILASAGRPSSNYLPPNFAGSSSYPRYHGVSGVAPNRPQHHSHSGLASVHSSASHYGQNRAAAQIPILRNDYTNDGNGHYNFGFETGNGIKRDENGQLNGPWPHGSLDVKGSYSYTGDDGKVYSVSYKADSNGFQAVGDHLPTPPPIPREIQETLHLHQRSSGGNYGSHSGYNAASRYGGSGSHHSPSTNYLPPSSYGRRH
ncbi:cuticular protein 11B [Haematobia irritans]|uniref:cuticular protein 11B n=1 Tax=Haematobia irritans TaxID=7368 RepID=UPI003F503B05